MSINYTRAYGWQETFDIWLYVKEKKWSIFDLFSAMMVGTFFMWRLGYEPWMREHFSYSKKKFEEGKFYTHFTSLISHRGKYHLGINIFMIASCVKMMRGVCNLNYLFALFTTAGIAANFMTHYRENNFVPRAGASAGVCALLATTCVFLPWKTMEVCLPMMGLWQRNYLWRLVVLFVTVDLMGLFYDLSPLGHDAHLVGFAVGALGALALKKYHVNVPLNHLWRKPVYKLRPAPPLWDTNHWAKMHATGRGNVL